MRIRENAVQDEVDRLVAAWRRERPGLDVGPLEVLSRVTRLAGHLDRIRRTVFARHALEMGECDVLSAVRRSGYPYRLSPGELLDLTLVGSGTLTNRVDRLVQKGLVRREPNPRDRRGVLVVLTPAGLAHVDDALADLLVHEQRLLGCLTPAEHEILAGLLRDLIRPFDNPRRGSTTPPVVPTEEGP
jgi:DNA-binding MarR family transcriptional regulator